MSKPTPNPDRTDVSAEREYARHLAHRLLNEASLALMEGRAGSVRVQRMDPEFGAVCGRSLQLLADRIDTISFTAPSRPEGTQEKARTPSTSGPSSRRTAMSNSTIHDTGLPGEGADR